MDVTYIARHRASTPAPRRGVIAFLLLHRIEWTDKHPGFAVAGLVLTGVLGGALNMVLR